MVHPLAISAFFICFFHNFFFLELGSDEDEIDETIAYANEKRKSSFMAIVSWVTFLTSDN